MLQPPRVLLSTYAKGVQRYRVIVNSILGSRNGEYAEEWVAENLEAGHWTWETFGDFLRTQAANQPLSVALVDDNTSITWADFLSETQRVSAGLAALGVGPGDAVSVQLVNSVELAISVLAIWELGAIYQPINPMYRKVECSGLLKSVNPKVVISSQANGFNHAELLDEIINDLDLSPAKVVIRSPRQGWHQFEALSGPEPHQPRNPLEHAIYGTTSGTTGTPKIYVHIQATQIFEAKALSEGLNIGPDDVMLAAAPLTHRGALMVGLMTSLISGSKLVMGDGSDTSKLAELIETQKVSSFMGIPTIVSDLLHKHQQDHFDATSLRVVVASGAPVTDELLARFQNQWPNAVPATGYGLTETGWCTFLRVGDPLTKIHTSGRRAPATEIEIRNESGNALPANEIGEVHIRGPMTCAGYLGNDNATAKAIDDMGWFASGDLAYLDDEGYIVPVGRSKHTIIRGGLNIYAEEIETMLQQHPSIKEAAVVAFPDPRLGERACACVSLWHGHSFDLTALQQYFAELDTARYTWPERVEILESLPRNAIGKIDRIAIQRLFKFDESN